MVKKYNLNVPDTWKSDPRNAIISMLEPLVAGTDYSLKVNTTDSSGLVIELHQDGMKIEP